MRDVTQPGGSTSGDATDERLLELAANGQSQALSVLYDRHGGIMLGLARRITGDASLAQDVVQDAFVGVWRNAARYSPDRASARTWMLSIVHHRAVDAMRRRRPTSELPEGDAPPAAMIVPDVWPEVAGHLDRDAVAHALSALSGPQREALELAYFSGLTQQEIAARTETPLGTVKSRVRLGLLAMRRELLAARSGAGGPVADRVVDDHTGRAPGPAADANHEAAGS